MKGRTGRRQAPVQRLAGQLQRGWQSKRPSRRGSFSSLLVYPFARHYLPGRRGIGIPIAALLAMFIGLGLSVLGLLWVAVIVAICCICAAGGAADARTEEWYAKREPVDQPSSQTEQGAA